MARKRVLKRDPDELRAVKHAADALPAQYSRVLRRMIKDGAPMRFQAAATQKTEARALLVLDRHGVVKLGRGLAALADDWKDKILELDRDSVSSTVTDIAIEERNMIADALRAASRPLTLDEVSEGTTMTLNQARGVLRGFRDWKFAAVVEGRYVLYERFAREQKRRGVKSPHEQFLAALATPTSSHNVFVC